MMTASKTIFMMKSQAPKKVTEKIIITLIVTEVILTAVS